MSNSEESINTSFFTEENLKQPTCLSLVLPLISFTTTLLYTCWDHSWQRKRVNFFKQLNLLPKLPFIGKICWIGRKTLKFLIGFRFTIIYYLKGFEVHSHMPTTFKYKITKGLRLWLLKNNTSVQTPKHTSVHISRPMLIN